MTPPLGPTTITAKIIIQQLLSISSAKDDSIPNFFIKWIWFYNELSNLNQLEIPRNYVGKNYRLVDIHCFGEKS